MADQTGAATAADVSTKDAAGSDPSITAAEATTSTEPPTTGGAGATAPAAAAAAAEAPTTTGTASGEAPMKPAGRGAGDEEVADGEEVSEATGTKRALEAQEPVKVGFKTFNNGKEALDYFRQLLTTSPKNVDFNEYEYLTVLDLLRKAHPNAAAKIGQGLRAIQVRSFTQSSDHETAKAFYAVRKDDTVEDFSYVKCCMALFPDEVAFMGKRTRTDNPAHAGRSGRSGDRGGGRRGGRGHGRRGGGRGRGRH